MDAERFALGPLANQDGLTLFMSTIGIAFIIEGGAQKEFFCFVVKDCFADSGGEVGFGVVPGFEFVGSMILHMWP